jgi:hypothetical protein
MTGWPTFSDSRLPIVLASTSLALPAAPKVTSLIVRTGYSWPNAEAGSNKTNAIAKRARIQPCHY